MAFADGWLASCGRLQPGTAALHLAMAALGVGPGDEVIVPAFTWVATPNAVVFQSGTPVFVDVDLATFDTTAEAIANAIGPRTVGILPVHLFGLMAEMDPILEVARQRGLWVVEDAACALGSLDLGRHAGRLGRLGCFSFHPRKSITTGEGGLLVTEMVGSRRSPGRSAITARAEAALVTLSRERCRPSTLSASTSTDPHPGGARGWHSSIGREPSSSCDGRSRRATTLS